MSLMDLYKRGLPPTFLSDLVAGIAGVVIFLGLTFIAAILS